MFDAWWKDGLALLALFVLFAWLVSWNAHPPAQPAPPKGAECQPEGRPPTFDPNTGEFSC